MKARPQSAVFNKSERKAENRYNRPRSQYNLRRSAPALNKSYGGKSLHFKILQDQEQKSCQIYDAFGLYISKTIKAGKGLWIPKFGQFTFTSKLVDLAGSTNPQIRDRQERLPVFVVGKDFVNGFPMNAGIASGMTAEAFEEGEKQDRTIRIFTQQNHSGIIPKVKINYCEIATLSGGSTKEECRDKIEQIISNFSSQARRGAIVDTEIPHVGRIIIKNNVAGVIFNQGLLEDCRGQTAKGFEHLFGSNNWMNNKIYNPDKGYFGPDATSDYYDQDFKNLNRSLRVSNDARQWMKNNLDLDYDQAHLSPMKNQTLTRNDVIQITPQKRSNRPMSAAVSRTQRSQVSMRSSRVSSMISRVPELAPFQLMNLASEIYGVRQAIIEKIQNGVGNVSLRDKISSSKINQILQHCGQKHPIGNLKALLKELGFNWNGPSCSMQNLIQQLKEYLNPEMKYLMRNEYQTTELKRRDPVYASEEQELLGLKRKEGFVTLVDIVKDLFYSSGKTLYKIFRENCHGDKITQEAFLDLTRKLSHGVLSDDDINQAFKQKSPWRSFMTFQEFEQSFKYEIPTVSHKNETLIIKKVRDWMFIRQFATETAFQRLLRSCDRLPQKSMRLPDFHKAMIMNHVGLSAPEIDYFFDVLAPGEKELKYAHWQSRIFDDALNPLHLLRELVQAEGLDSNDVLFQMKIKVWDEPIGYEKFKQCIRRLDQTFSDSQCKALFDKLKNKSDLVDVQSLIFNLTGTEFETVDFKNKMFKLLYKQVDTQSLLTKLESYDDLNDGKIKPQNLEKVLQQCTNFSEEELRKFIRQIPRDFNNKIAYIEFLDRIEALGDKNSNPFKHLVQRLAYFLETNKLTVTQLIERLGGNISQNKFADFVKQKVEKKRDLAHLQHLVKLMDVDKDGMIGDQDLKACLQNLQTVSFFKNDGAALYGSQFNSEYKYYPVDMYKEISDTKVVTICDQIRKAMVSKKMSVSKVFKICDVNNAGMINLAQFSKGINSITSISVPLLEKIFNIMDRNKIGIIDLAKFKKVINIEVPAQIPRAGDQVEDGFDWQENVIQMIQKWVNERKLGANEAFKSFDKDFDGLISKEDMKESLKEYMNLKPEDLYDSRMDRLFRIMSFYKTEQLQISDFERILKEVNPYVGSASNASKSTFASSLGGGFQMTQTSNWKFACLQQIGLVISQNYSTIEDSFYQATKKSERMSFKQFTDFLEVHDALKGFNLTEALLQKLFAEIDPHRKTFLILKDWISAFQTFDKNDNVLMEFKNFIQVQFTNARSAFSFFQSQQGHGQIYFEPFEKCTKSMIASRKLTKSEIKHVFDKLSSNGVYITLNDLEREFKGIEFTGTQSIQKKKKEHNESFNHVANSFMKETSWITQLRPLGSAYLKNKTRTQPSQRIGGSNASKWETDIIDKLQRLIKKQNKSLDAIFKQFDSDGSGDISKDEFRKAMKLISLQLTNMEIDKIIQRVDANNDGVINYTEFAQQFRNDDDFDKTMMKRANDRLSQLHELMILHMSSPAQAFANFDSSKQGQMTYVDFDKLVNTLLTMGKKQIPCYTVIKDMFDAIDATKDQVIDPKEWRQTFGGYVQPRANSATVKGSTVTSDWVDGPLAEKIGTVLAKNRDHLKRKFIESSSHSDHRGESKYVTFDQAKRAVKGVIQKHLKGQPINDQQLKGILKVGQIQSKISAEVELYDFNKMLNVYAARLQDAQLMN